MRVLITGATTPLGAGLVDALLAHSDVELVLAIGSEREGRPNDRRRIYRGLDLRRPRVMHDLVRGEARALGITTVIHGMQHRRAADRGHGVRRQNVEATRELLEACAHHPTIRHLVYRSFAEVYAVGARTATLLDEDAPLDFDPGAPQWLRDRVEADLTVCTHRDDGLATTVLRCAEILAPDTGSQLWDYLQSRVCLRPLGFDPMINVLALEDAIAAHVAAVRGDARGVFNIPGFDTLPLSRAIVESHRADLPVPGPLLPSLYGLRRMVAGFDFRYDLNLRRFHFGGLLDGTRAAASLGYRALHPVRWPHARWFTILERLAELRAS